MFLNLLLSEATKFWPAYERYSGGIRKNQRRGSRAGQRVHSAHIAPGREGLFDLIKSLPPTLKYEPGTIVGEGDFVIVHGRFSNFGLPVNWIAADIVRIKDGVLVEHWDVIQDEVTQEQSKSGQPMFGRTFATYASAR
jgi:predicted SnoaL-like aldol condensation-catalyzing enzyme